MTTEQEWAALKEAAEQCPAGSLVMGRPSTILALEAEHSRLRAENERLRGALEPFAKAGELFAEPAEIFDQWVFLPAAGEEYALTGNHLRAARAALAQEGE